MVDKAHRFQGHGSLRFVYQKGQTIRGQYCSLKYIPNKRRRKYRVAIVVSRKVHKSAVVRNRIRRRIYEIVRSQTANIKEPYDLVITAYSDQLAEMPSQQLQQVILDKLDRAEILLTTQEPATANHAIVESKEN